MANFIIADNQELTRFAVERLIRQDESSTIRRASDRAGLVELLKEQENSVVVLDYTLFDFAGEDQLLVISERFSMATWVLLSSELTEKLIRNVAYSSHAFSIVYKDSPLRELRDALNAAVAGNRFLGQRVMESLLSQEPEKTEQEVLTSTEMDIVKAIAQGKTTKEIAAERYSSIHTITTHRKNIFRKLKVNTAHELIKHALRAGWVDPGVFYI